MNSHDRILAVLEGRPVDRLPRMPITMMFAADVAGVPYGRYATDYRVMVEAQLRTAEAFDFDYVSCISDPAREAADCGATVQFFDDQPPAIDEIDALLADKTKLAPLETARSLGRRPDARPRAGGGPLPREGRRPASGSKAGSKAPVPRRPTCGASIA